MERVFTWKHLPQDYPEKYDQWNKKYNNLYTKSALELVSLANIKEGESVLEVACGTGIASQCILDCIKDKGRLVGIDISDTMLSRARKRFSDARNVCFNQIDGFSLSEILKKEGEFDAVLSNFGYWYLMTKAPVFFKEVHKTLSVGGRLVFNVTPFLRVFELNGNVYNSFARVYREEIESSLKKHGFDYKDCPPPHIHQKNIHKALEDTGFSQVRFKPFPLPITVEEALDFMHEAFFSWGSKPPWETSHLPYEKNIKIHEESIKNTKEKLAQIGNKEKPYIFTVFAKKLGKLKN